MRFCREGALRRHFLDVVPLQLYIPVIIVFGHSVCRSHNNSVYITQYFSPLGQPFPRTSLDVVVEVMSPSELVVAAGVVLQPTGVAVMLNGTTPTVATAGVLTAAHVGVEVTDVVTPAIAPAVAVL